MPIKTLRQWALTAAISCFAFGAAAGAAGDRVFVEGVFDIAPTGAEILYDHNRKGVAGPEVLQPIDGGEVSIILKPTESGGREAVLEMRADGRQRGMNPYPAQYGNPILMTFLESSLRSMARITGGSPFYIRNRMKEALRIGGTVTKTSATVNGAAVEADEVVFRPFEKDGARERMGDFGNLELRFILADAAPGGFVSLSARTNGDSDEAVFEELITYREMRSGG